MTAMAWFDALQWIHIVLIVAILLLFVGYIYLLKRVTQLEFIGGLVGKQKIRVFGILFGSLVVAYLFYNLDKIQPNEWVEISLLAGLVAATGGLALVTLQQVHTSVTMTLAMYRPRILLERRSGTRGTYFMKEIGIGFWNDQGGAAINVEFHISHPVFEFDAFRYPLPISARDEPHTHDFCVKQPSVEDDPGVPIDPVALVVANYEDVSGNPWHSTLELIWNATTKDIKPGYMRVAVSGHHNMGGDRGD